MTLDIVSVITEYIPPGVMLFLANLLVWAMLIEPVLIGLQKIAAKTPWVWDDKGVGFAMRWLRELIRLLKRLGVGDYRAASASLRRLDFHDSKKL